MKLCHSQEKMISSPPDEEIIQEPIFNPRPLLLLKNIDEWVAFILLTSFPVQCSTVQLTTRNKKFYLKPITEKREKSEEGKEKRLAAVVQWREEKWREEEWSIIFANF